MPEGGSLVAGVLTKVGFKAIGEDGKGVQISGKIVNSKQQEVAAFQSVHKGMGSFELTPQSGESYTAKVILPGNIAKNYLLPAVNLTGTALKVISKNPDSLQITLTATPNLPGPAPTSASYYLIGQARGVVCYAVHLTLSNGQLIKQVAKSIFPTGIAHFTLLNQANQPLNERLIYINHNDNLQLTINSDSQNYNIPDSIALALAVKDKDGKPVQGIFSLAVTDDSQVTTDTLCSNILNDLLFTSDLKGTVEEPGYYLEESTPQGTAELDNLLLTQGWVGYNWKNIFGPATEPLYNAEKEFIVEGKVTNALNKPVAKSLILLFSQKPAMVKDTVTDKDGRFIFKNLFPIDTAVFKIQARNKKGNSFNLGIEMLHEFKPPVFSANGSISPWYVNSDTVLLNNTNSKIAQLKAEANYHGESNLLKVVNIKAKKVVKGSKDLHFLGDADLILDEQDMLKAGKMSLRQMLEQKLGFSLRRIDLGRGNDGMSMFRMNYKIGNNEVTKYSFDGIDIFSYYVEPSVITIKNVEPWIQKIYWRKQFEDTYLDYFSAEEIAGIEVWYKGFGAHLEITTRGGKGPFMKITPGTYVYKPLPFTLPKEFYRPRYTVKNKNTAIGVDLRSTIHWEPNLVTDTTGKATVSFYSADRPADYTIIIEGTDLNGNIGYRRQKIKVLPKAIAAK